MTRSDLQVLAEARLGDAKALLNAERWAGACYLLGYAVECALKACIARRFRQDEVPEKQLVADFYTHRLEKLLVISALRAAFDERAKAEPGYVANWDIVVNWSEGSSYDHATPEAKAREMLGAVADPTNGILPWLKTQW